MTESQHPLPLELRVESGPCAGHTGIIRARQATIGRSAGCDLALEHDATVSREHATLTWEAGEWVLRDLGSKNGTSLITPGGSVALDASAPVAPGNRFMVGSAIIGLYPTVSEATPEQLRVHLVGDTLHHELLGDGSIALQAAIPHRADVLQELQREIRRVVAASLAGAPDTDPDFLQWGQKLAHALLPETIAAALQKRDSPLSLVLDPALLPLPWEAVTLSEFPLCLQRPLARQVVAQGTRGAAPMHAGPPRIVIVANPTGDLAIAQAEAEDLLHLLIHDYALHDVRFLALQRARRAEVLKAFSACDAVVYLGHAAHDAASPQSSGWRLADGVLPAEAFVGATHAPRLILASACESARESHGGVDLTADTAGFAAALMMAGAEQFIGTQWPVPVVSGGAFAAVSFTEIMRGHTTGEAVLTARRRLRHAMGTPLQVCAGYVHYGSPQWRLWR